MFDVHKPTHPKETYRLPVIDGCFFIDNSTLVNYTECGRKGYYAAIRRMKPNYSAWALEYGRRIHKALEERYTNSSHVFYAGLNTTDLMQQNLAQSWNKSPEPEGEWRNLDLACKTVELYNKQYQAENFEVLSLPDSDKLACEIAFALPLFNCTIFEIPTIDIVTGEKKTLSEIPVFFTGRIDLITEESDGSILITDHKTSSVAGATLFDQYFTGSQMKGYVWAASHLLGKRVNGARINVLGARPPTKTKPYNTFFERQNVYYTKGMIEEWVHNTRLQIINMLVSSLNQSETMDTSSCVTKFGRCPFYSVCQLDPEQREFMISSGDFKVNTWDPTKEEDEKPLETKGIDPRVPDTEELLKNASLASVRSLIDG